MKTSDSYHVELTGPGLSMKRELKEAQAHKLLIWLLKGGNTLDQANNASDFPLSTGPEASDTAITGDVKGAAGSLISVREFMERFEPRRLPDKIACFGLYLREHRSRNEFSKADIVLLFQEAAEPLPKNLGRDLRWTQSIAWIAPAPANRDNFYLTKKGEDAVRGRFPKTAVAKTRQPIQRRRQNDSSSSKPAETLGDQPASLET